MLLKTDKMLHMVENKMALAPGESADFEERERARQREIHRLEEESRVEREKRAKEAQEKERHTSLMGGFFGRDRPLSTFAATAAAREREVAAAREREREANLARARELQKERSEAERNRDLLLASRRVSAISPDGRERSTPGAPAAGTPKPASAPSTETKPANGAAGAAGTASAGPAAKPGEIKPRSSWEGDPVMAGVALPRREQGLGRLGRGLWSFDVRG